MHAALTSSFHRLQTKTYQYISPWIPNIYPVNQKGQIVPSTTITMNGTIGCDSKKLKCPADRGCCGFAPSASTLLMAALAFVSEEEKQALNI